MQEVFSYQFHKLPDFKLYLKWYFVDSCNEIVLKIKTRYVAGKLEKALSSMTLKPINIC